VDALVEGIRRHGDWLKEHRDEEGVIERRTREFSEVLISEIEERAARSLRDGDGKSVGEILAQVRDGSLNPYSASRALISSPLALRELLHTEAAASDGPLE
jgi:hypothetical protein